jgi:hypothetical protein
MIETDKRKTCQFQILAEGSWADLHFDEVFTSQAIKEYY